MNNVPSNVQKKGLQTMNEKDVKKETEKSKITKILVQSVIYIFLFVIAIIVIVASAACKNEDQNNDPPATVKA